MNKNLLIAAITFGLSFLPKSHAAPADDITLETGVTSGLAVLLAPADATLALDLASDGRFLVQGLTLDKTLTGKFRDDVSKAGCSGLVTIHDLASLKTLSGGGRMQSELRLGGGVWVQSCRLSEADRNADNTLDGRNAFNGLLLWRKKETRETNGARGLQDSTFCTDGKRAYGILDDPKTRPIRWNAENLRAK